MRLRPLFPFVKLAALAILVSLASPAVAKTDDKEAAKDKGPHLRYARSYAEAMAEAKERGCVVFATFHKDG